MTNNNQQLNRENENNREDLAGEHRLGDTLQLIAFVLFMATWITDALIIKFTSSFSTQLTILFRLPLAIFIFAISIYLARSGLKIVFQEVRPEPQVIREGVFSIVRHPIYLGAILIYLGFLILSFSILATFLWIIIIGLYLYLCKHEENLLTKKFGDDYIQYMKDVPMLIPRIKA